MGLERINELKKAKGLTNPQLSELTGIAISTLDKITSGANKNPKLETLQLICRALDCTLDDFDDYSKFDKFSAKEMLHIKKYRTLDEHGKKIVDNLLENEYERCSAVSTEHGAQSAVSQNNVYTAQIAAFGGGNIEKEVSEENLKRAIKAVKKINKKKAKGN